MALLVVVPGFGPPYLPEKRAFLGHNLRVIRATYPGSITVRVFNYGDEPAAVEPPQGVTLIETMEKGIVGQFLYRHIIPQSIQGFDTVLILLDDITLHPQTNVASMLEYMGRGGVDIVTPALSAESQLSHGFMLQQRREAAYRRVTFCELFCYLMTRDAYERYYRLFDGDTTWCWGLDLCLHPQGFKMSICDAWPMTHHYKGVSYGASSACPYVEMNRVISKYGRVGMMQVLADEETG